MEIKISEKDLIAIYQLHSSLERKHVIVIAILFILFCIYLLLTSTHPYLLILCGFLGGVIGWATYYYGLVTYKSKKIYRQQKALKDGYELEITDEGLIVTSAKGSGRNQWSDFCKYKQNKGYLLLYYSDALFLMLPKEQIPLNEIETISANISKIKS